MNEVNENETIAEAGEQETEPLAKNNETKAEKFIRLGEYRMKKRLMLLADWNILPTDRLMNIRRSRWKPCFRYWSSVWRMLRQSLRR